LAEDGDFEGTSGFSDKESVHNIQYTPAVAKDEVDTIVLRLKAVLKMWQSEMNDPIINK